MISKKLANRSKKKSKKRMNWKSYWLGFFTPILIGLLGYVLFWILGILFLIGLATGHDSGGYPLVLMLGENINYARTY